MSDEIDTKDANSSLSEAEKFSAMDPEIKAFERGTGQWQGVVCIDRKEFYGTKMLVNVYSAKTMTYGGRRAIKCQLPWSIVEKYFQAGDGPEAYTYAEFKDNLDGQPGHLELYEKASHREFFLNASPMAKQAIKH